MTTGPGAVVLGTHVTGLWVTRALAAAGVRTTVLSVDETDLARYSRHAAEVAAPFDGGITELRDLLLRSHRWRGRVLVPTGDLALETLSRHRSELERYYAVAAPDWSAVRIFLRKRRAHRLARRLGLVVPRDFGPLEAVLTQNGQVTFPVVLKPDDSRRFHRRFGVKLFVATSPSSLTELGRRVVDAGLRARVLELVPGPDTLAYNYTAYYSRSGERLAECGVHKLRKSPPFFGIGRVVETLADREILATMRDGVDALVAATGLHGPVSAEFKRHPGTGELVFIELNPRCSFVQQIALRRGVRYPLLLHDEALGRPLRPVDPGDWNGTLIHLHADLLNGLLQRRAERIPLRDLLAPYLGPRTFAVLRWTDPLPFVAEWSRTARESLALPFSGRRRAVLRDRLAPAPPWARPRTTGATPERTTS